jgi:hypothetical protein
MGKMRKTKRALPPDYITLRELTTTLLNDDSLARYLGFAVSRTPATTEQCNQSNKLVAFDWAIVNKEYLKNKNNVFGVFYDTNIGLVHIECEQSTGQAGEALEGYIQKYGQPDEILHDNAKEFIHGNFAALCKSKGIRQKTSSPYTPNQNPAEKYMEILTSGARSLLYTAGLSYEFFWEHALLHRAYLQNIMALPGRCSPFELRTGQQPILSYLRIFGCETLSYIEQTKRKKFEPKAERGIYLGTSPTHSIDTYKIWNLRTGQIMYRRNTAFNEKNFPAMKMAIRTVHDNNDDGADLVGLDFMDDGVRFTITGISTSNGDPTITYIDPLKPLKDGQQHESTVKEVRTWYNKTCLLQASNSLNPHKRTYMNDLAIETFRHLCPPKTYDVQLHDPTRKAPTSYKAAGNRESQWFSAEDKEQDGILQFKTWQRLPQHSVTPQMRKKALHIHLLYDVKRD